MQSVGGRGHHDVGWGVEDPVTHASSTEQFASMDPTAKEVVALTRRQSGGWNRRTQASTAEVTLSWAVACDLLGRN